MISMSKIQDIRRMRSRGDSVAEISRSTGISEPTIRKYLKPVDLSPKMPVRTERPSVMDRYAPLVDSWLEADRYIWHKQRHTAQRIFERLKVEHGAEISYNTVQRYVKRWKESRRDEGRNYLDQVGIPADMQVDFGQVDCYVADVRKRLHLLVCDFPFSNVGLAQVFLGENAECVCEGLMAIFSYINGVPRRIIFDNATGVGRKVSGAVRTSALFASFAAHCGFEYVFCNPDAGHEKGGVENKVGALRRRLFVPLPQFSDFAAFNARLLDRCMELANDVHYAKGEPSSQLFVEDAFALLPLPEVPFRAVCWQRMKADKYGNVLVDGRHRYSSAPEYGSCELIVGKTAFAVEIYDAAGEHIATHPRAYGDRPTASVEPASQLALLCRKPAGWPNSRVRDSLPEDLRDWADSIEEEARREFLRILRDVSAESGYSCAVEAAERIVEVGAVPDRAAVTVLAQGICNGRGEIIYEDAVDMSAYDVAFARAEGR